MDFTQLFDWRTLLITAAIVTFVVSAINTVQTKVSTNWLVFIIAFIVTILNTTFVAKAHFADWQKIITQMLLTMAFSVLFYNYIGKLFVDDVFQWLKKKLSDSFGKSDPPPPVQ